MGEGLQQKFSKSTSTVLHVIILGPFPQLLIPLVQEGNETKNSDFTSAGLFNTKKLYGIGR